MYDSGVNSEGMVDYNTLFCHACLSCNRKLTMVGDYIDIYIKICDNSRMALTPQVNVCWECLALLKKVRAFKKKVDNAQKILDYCVNKHAPLKDSLSDLTTSHTEYTSLPILNDVNDKLTQIKTEPIDEEDSYMDVSNGFTDISRDIRRDGYVDISRDAPIEYTDMKEQTMCNIEDVRGECEIDVKPDFNILSSGVTIKSEPLSEEQRSHRRWKSSVMLIYKRLCAHKYAVHFRRPVSDELAPDYSRTVHRPMDLATIRRNIQRGVIRTTEEFKRDLLLMFSNALMYNSNHHVIYHMAQELRQETLNELALLSEAQADSPLSASRRRRTR